MADNLTIGQGELYLAPFLPGTTTPGAFDFFGNCPGFTLTVENEEITHMTSTQRIKEEDESVVTSNTVGGSISTDNVSPTNLARFFLGTSATVTQASGVGTTETVAAAAHGVYQLGLSDATPTGVRSVSNVVVEDTGGAGTTYVLNTDYLVDPARGTVEFLATGAIVAGDSIDITYDNAAGTRDQVISGQAQAEGAMRYIAFNTAGADIDYFLPRVKLSPTGDLALIGEDWMSIELSIKALKLRNRAKVYADGQIKIA